MLPQGSSWCPLQSHCSLSSISSSSSVLPGAWCDPLHLVFCSSTALPQGVGRRRYVLGDGYGGDIWALSCHADLLSIMI